MGIDSLAENSVNMEYMKKVLVKNELVTYKNPATQTITTINGGKARGTLIGGNLSVFVAMLGTPYLPPMARIRLDWQNVILFFEDVHESTEHLDRYFSSLTNAGILNNVAGVIFGTCLDCSATQGYGVNDLVHNILVSHLTVFCSNT